MYVHCHAHRLNLALVDSVKAVQAAAEFFVLLEKLYAYMCPGRLSTLDGWKSIRSCFPVNGRGNFKD